MAESVEACCLQAAASTGSSASVFIMIKTKPSEQFQTALPCYSVSACDLSVQPVSIQAMWLTAVMCHHVTPIQTQVPYEKSNDLIVIQILPWRFHDFQPETFAKLLCESSPTLNSVIPAQAGIHFPLEVALKSTS